MTPATSSYKNHLSNNQWIQVKGLLCFGFFWKNTVKEA